MIIDLEKYLFVGRRDELEGFFEQAQKIGVIQFLSKKFEKPISLPPNIQEIITALKILRKQPLKPPYTGIYNKNEAERAVDRILEIQRKIEKFEDEEAYLKSEITRIAPLGDFSCEEIAYLEEEGNLHFQFFCVKSSKGANIELSEDLIFIGAEYDLDYYFSIGRKAQSFPGMIEIHFEKTAPELRLQLESVYNSLKMLWADLKEFAGYIQYLRIYLREELNGHHLYVAKREAERSLGDALFSIEGWVPKNKVEELTQLTENIPLIVEKIAVEKSDQVPTYMENKGINHIGEDLVHIYDTPAPLDKDPSGWVFWSFALFFAIIVGDGGYGLLYLALAAYIKYKFPGLKGKGARILRLITILSTSCIVWGVLTGSFFGISFRPQSPFSKVSMFYYLAEKKAEYHIKEQDKTYKKWVGAIPSLSQATTGGEFLEMGVRDKEGKVEYAVKEDFQDGIFLEITLLIGVIHIAVSLLRYAFRNWASFGWLAALIGGYLYFPIFLKTVSLAHFLHLVTPEAAEAFGEQILLFGVGLAVVLALVQKRLKGMGEIANSIQIFGDVLSYLRLYALALASSILAKTANNMGADVGHLLGIFIILFGHGINIALGLMSAVIHGLRLNFIEWYHYSYVGGGKLFNPLRKN